MPIPVNDGFGIAAPRYLDMRCGKIVAGKSVPFDTVAEAKAAIPETRRCEGLIVYVKTGSVINEYQFVGGVADVNLVLKAGGGGAGQFMAGAGDDSIQSIYGDCEATGPNAFAVGTRNTANGASSVALGSDTTANGSGSFAVGQNTVANGAQSIAGGYMTTASGVNATALGNQTTAQGNNSLAHGNGSLAEGDNSVALGEGAYAKEKNQVVVGKFNEQDTIALFVVGNGIDDTLRKNAFTVRNNGAIVFGDSIEFQPFVVDSIAPGPPDARLNLMINGIEYYIPLTTA